MAVTMGSDRIRASATRVDDTAVAALRAAFAGEVVSPADAGYHEHRRVRNGSIDRFPALIARCASVDDVRTAVRPSNFFRLNQNISPG